MNIEKKQIDDLNIKLTLNIAADDYAPIKKKKLNERRRTAEFKGFRKGMVPASLIERVYGEQCLGDAVNDIISEQLGKYMDESGLNFIGEPLTSEDQPEIEWKDGNDFTFMFDLAVAPKIDFELSSSDKVVNYTIKSTAVAKEEMKRNMLMQYGEMQEVEAPTPESYLYVDLENDDKTVENGYISMRDVTEAMKPALMGVKAGDKLELNINEVLDREGDRATLLKVKKEDLAGINPVFNATVVNIKNFEAATPTPETFDRIFGDGNVKTEEDFEECSTFLEEIGFYEMHVFKYSRRKGTPADRMPQQHTDKTKTARSHVLLEMSKRQSEEFRLRRRGKTDTILVEEREVINGREVWVGFTREYVRMAVDSDLDLKNQLVTGEVSGMLNEEVMLLRV